MAHFTALLTASLDVVPETYPTDAIRYDLDDTPESSDTAGREFLEDTAEDEGFYEGTLDEEDQIPAVDADEAALSSKRGSYANKRSYDADLEADHIEKRSRGESVRGTAF